MMQPGDSPGACPDFGKTGLLCNETASRRDGNWGAKRLSKRSIGVLMPDFEAWEWPIAVRSKTGASVRRELRFPDPQLCECLQTITRW